MHIIFYEKLDNDNYENINNKKEIIILINKNKISVIITMLIKKINEGFLKIKCKFNSKIKIIIKIFIKIKKRILRKSIFRIINNTRLFLIFEK